MVNIYLWHISHWHYLSGLGIYLSQQILKNDRYIHDYLDISVILIPHLLSGDEPTTSIIIHCGYPS